MFNGIIYRYYLTNEKGREVSYVGQTCSEKHRRADFLNINICYGGKRIENARKKYSPKAFNYEVLETVRCDTIKERSSLLNKLEIYYINLFNSYKQGYNNTIGGGGANGYEHSDEYKKWQSEKTKELAKNPLYREKISEGIKSYYHNKPNARTNKSIEVQKRYENPLARDASSLAQKKSYDTNPNRAKQQAQSLSKTCSTAEGRKRMRNTIIEAWTTKEYREKYSQSKKALWATNEYRDKMKIAFNGMNGKPVIQLSLDGTIINEFESATEAGRQLGYSFGSICRVCRGDRSQYKGFLWKYKR